MVELGLGKNMVRSLRFWVETMGVAKVTKLRRFELTPFGHAVFGEDGRDRYLEDPRTLWLLHWNLSSRSDGALFAWRFMLNHWPYPEFTRTEALDLFQRESTRLGHTHSAITLSQHFDVFLHSYHSARAASVGVEDSLDAALVEISLIQSIGERRVDGGRWETVYSFRREPKQDITPELFDYCLLDFWARFRPSEETLTLREVASGECSPGQVFKLPEDDVRARLEEYAFPGRERPFPYQPYAVQVARNSSSVLSGIAHKVDGPTRMLLGELRLVTDIVLLLAVISALVAVHPVVATLAGAGFGGSYTLASWGARRRLQHNGLLIAREQTNIIKVVQEGLGGIRDVLLDWTQPVYAEVYRKANSRLRRAAGDNQFLAGAPKSVMDAIGIVLVVGLTCWLSRTSGGLNAALPVLGVLALGGQRLLPVFQQAYDSWSLIAVSIVPVSEVLDMLDQPLPAEVDRPAPAPLGLQHGIRFKDVKFRYVKDGPWVLDGLNLSIPKGIRMGVVGATGSGKSTLLDLLTGLLEATEGSILVDGLPVTGERLRAWQRSVAHVPQSIYLSDSTIAENIAFGTPPQAIDMERVRQVAAEAQIADFIESRQEGYSSMIGERGIRLSGGQRQRVGIARALYKKGSVLVFDEATSALDNTTEQSVIDTIESLDRDLTVIIIAHRLTTVQRCDRFVELIGGRAVEYESYEHMVERSPSARHIVVAS